MPEAAPVTIAVLPAKSNRMASLPWTVDTDGILPQPATAALTCIMQTAPLHLLATNILAEGILPPPKAQAVPAGGCPDHRTP